MQVEVEVFRVGRELWGRDGSRAERKLRWSRVMKAAKKNINKAEVTRANGISLRLSTRNYSSGVGLQPSIGCLADS
jgi:hypothetical protein